MKDWINKLILNCNFYNIKKVRVVILILGEINLRWNCLERIKDIFNLLNNFFNYLKDKWYKFLFMWYYNFEIDIVKFNRNIMWEIEKVIIK